MASAASSSSISCSKLADGFHVVFFQIGLGQLGGIVLSEDLDLHNVMVLPGSEFLAATITRNVQHETKTSLTNPVVPSRTDEQGVPRASKIRAGLPREWKTPLLSIRRRF